MADVKTSEVKKTVGTDPKPMVTGTKIDWSVVSKETVKMKDQLVEVHEAITTIWTVQKSRELATLESCVRNVVEYLDRIPAAAAKFGSKPATENGKRSSVLSKPR